jgi:hypothetical protein
VPSKAGKQASIPYPIPPPQKKRKNSAFSDLKISAACFELEVQTLCSQSFLIVTVDVGTEKWMESRVIDLMGGGVGVLWVQLPDRVAGHQTSVVLWLSILQLADEN